MIDRRTLLAAGMTLLLLTTRAVFAQSAGVYRIGFLHPAEDALLVYSASFEATRI